MKIHVTCNDRRIFSIYRVLMALLSSIMSGRQWAPVTRWELRIELGGRWGCEMPEAPHVTQPESEIFTALDWRSAQQETLWLAKDSAGDQKGLTRIPHQKIIHTCTHSPFFTVWSYRELFPRKRFLRTRRRLKRNLFIFILNFNSKLNTTWSHLFMMVSQI